jgi:hypothetical protein
LRPVGTASSSSRDITSRRELVCTSTTGVSPVTVMLSATEPIRISTLIGAVKFVSKMMPARTMAENPANVNVTV